MHERFAVIDKLFIALIQHLAAIVRLLVLMSSSYEPEYVDYFKSELFVN